ncbi:MULTISPECIES: ABC transporter ATP-binding protein [unclassified Leptolyngbya]|uniref:ABC transporter ATP-binding protein n=1 Tax=unclassified Leptolyngbya TaxID=2650499 RepID=UPI001683CF7F|nr:MULTISPECIES: ABC transporter ATP-binding protein [unclassified Leptolyngbya]MBD1910532.1 ABC transporter ATP-binding protein [Leptolyngbya sp. FACHB-8]MBD2153903.1 ABC transporter ATP-binding protein [Leptolyngbya sp. FACHB-16]
MIEADHLSKVYGSTSAIEDVTFSVESGEILGFLGPNGAGKTTTMRILTGYLPASQGTARIAGFDVHENSMAVRQNIGYLPETPPLYTDMTVEGFLWFVARLKGVAAGDRPTRVTAALKRCNLEEKRQVLIRKLSKGFRQRVGIAQALVHDPPVIILDEPTVGLDPRQIIDVRNLIKSLAGDHTIILSTHILPEVSMTCSRVAIINKGRVVATNTPDQLVTEMYGGNGYELEVDGNFAAVEATLKNLPEVRSVESLPDLSLAEGHYRLRVMTDGPDDLGRQVSAAVVGSGLGLYEMRRIRISLEDVFLELTTQETSPEDVESDTESESEPIATPIEPTLSPESEEDA